MAQFETWLKAELHETPEVQVIHGNLFADDSKANKIGVIVTSQKEPVSLAGVVDGLIVRSDGVTIPVSGSEYTGLDGDRAWIILPPSAYVVTGQLSIVIRLTHNGSVTVLGACIGYVYRTTTDAVIDPGQIVPNIAQLMSMAGQIADVSAMAQAAVAEMDSGMASVIMVQGTQPTNIYNKIWLDNSNPQAVQIKVRAQDGTYYAPEMYTGERGPKGETGETGPEGTTFIPEVSAEGVISWTNNSGKTNPQPTSIKGPKGDTGPAPGITRQYEEYADGGSATTPPDEGWDGEPDPVQGSYLWTRHTIEWADGQTTILYAVAYQGENGTGTGTVKSVNGIDPDNTGNVSLPGNVVDQTVTQGSTNAVSGGAVWTAIDAIDTPDADTAMSDTSENPVQNRVIKAALDTKAPLASPALTGTPTAPTATSGTNSTQIASTAFVQAAVAGNRPYMRSVSIAAADWSSGSVPFTYTYSIAGVNANTIIRAYPSNAASAALILDAIFLTPGNGNITFSTNAVPDGQITLTLHLEQGQSAAGTTCIVSRAGGGTAGGTIDLVNAIDQNPNTVMNYNAVYKQGYYAIIALDFTCDSVTTKNIGVLPVGYRPAAQTTVQGTLINGSTQATGNFIIQEASLGGRIRYNDWDQDTTLTGVKLLAMIDTRTVMEAVFTFRWDSASTIGVTELVNRITKDVVAGTVHYEYECVFDDTAKVGNVALLVPEGFGTSNTTRQSVSYSASTTGDYSELTLTTLYSATVYGGSFTNRTTTAGSTNALRYKIDLTLPVA